MAQLNITLDQGEILELLSENQGEAFKNILQASLNKILQAESCEQLKAASYERSEERTDCRNGSRERELRTRIGWITLTVPRHRNVPFKTSVSDNYSRSEAALIVRMEEMVFNSASTRKISRVMEELCHPFSRLQSQRYVRILTRLCRSSVGVIWKENIRFYPLMPRIQREVKQQNHFQNVYDYLWNECTRAQRNTRI